MRLKKKIFLLISVIISLLAVASLSGYSSITVGGKTLKRPDEITLYRLCYTTIDFADKASR